MDDTSLSPATYFDAETLKELRETAKSYQKLDFAYLASAGAIVTTLKIGNYDLIELPAQVWGVVAIFILLTVNDTLISHAILTDWIAAKTNATKRLKIRSITIALDIQHFMHGFFITGIVAIALGFSMGATSVRERYSAKAGIQDATELFISSAKRLPGSVNELVSVIPSASRWRDALKHEPIKFEPDKKEKYRITFAGKDGLLDTADDDVVTSSVKLNSIIKKIKAGQEQ